MPSAGCEELTTASGIIAIEGGVCSGKSTVCRLFRDDGWIVLDEMYVPKRDERSFYGSQTPQEILGCFIAYEVQKARGARRAGGAIVDRSLYSVFAYQYAAAKAAGKALPDYVTAARSALSAADWPDWVFFVNIDDSERRARYEKRGVHVSPLLLDTEFNRVFLEHIQTHGPPNLYVLDGHRLAQDLFSDIREILRDATPPATSHRGPQD